MPQFTTFKLSFTAPLHLAKGKIDYDIADNVLHSDTLKSALAVCALQLGITDKVESFLENFQISSAFPFYGEEYFFPKPNFLEAEQESNNRLQINDLEASKQRKKVKKIQFIGKSHFEKLLVKKQTFPENHFQGSFLSEIFVGNEKLKIFQSETQERVQIPHIVDAENPTRPYYVDRLYFAEGAGLYFIIQAKEETTIKKVESCLKLLGDNGLGTDRNVGNGQFESERKEITLNLPENASHCTNISLYCPHKEELMKNNDLNVVSYNLMKRGGWMASPADENHISLRKRSIYMFQEGSIFPKGDLKGKIVNLKPENKKLEEMKVNITHPIFRDGQALFFPILI
ncbi:MAG: type III-A CRISPR-associated RAMP protein Csm4 [Microscillaceae bacterium]|jgi:CRISPR-associated protein Csm4|nr:type III-A CRISPR-associated RAMP protein Csm4 [Microscillaceae bacterium]